jgi:hypothetical protein
MTDTPRLHEIATKPVCCEIDGMAEVNVLRDIPYATVEDEVLTMDIYRPPTASRQAVPAVIFVTGYPDPGARRVLGCNVKDMASYQSWGRLIAASGLAAVTYTNLRPESAAADVIGVVRTRAESLAIDPSRIGLWSCSGNVPNALAALIEGKPRASCAVLCYGYMLDAPGSTRVADAARQFGFVNPTAGRSVRDIPHEVPLLVARAGADEMPGLNESLDGFVQQAIALDRPVTFVNQAGAAHAFEINERTPRTSRLVRQILAFLQLHLGAADGSASR